MVVDLFMFHCLGDTPLKTLKRDGCDPICISARSLSVSREWVVGERIDAGRPVAKVRAT